MSKTHVAKKEMEREDSASNGDELVIDINPLANHIRANFKSLGPPLSLECCIYRVPHDLRKVNEAAYTPKIVSIGPFHHGKDTLKRMEEYKLRYLKKFIDRVAESASLEDFINTIKRCESRIRSCYAETFDHLNSDDFVKMILVDAGFIFEYFLWESSPDLNDFIFYKLRLHNDIGQDLILLENQLPFFVLKRLYNLAFPSRPNTIPSFLQLTCHSFSHYNKQDKSIPNEVELKHFTDLLRYFLLPKTHSATEQNDKSKDKINLYSATELHDAGVKFEVSPSNCLFDIDFSNGVLTIPCLKLYDDTESYIRNLIALEQCHYPFETFICNYVSIMDHLINTSKDVDLLVRKKIIVHWLGNQGPVATLFNKLCTHIGRENDSWYNNLCKGLNEHYGVRCHRWKAILRHEYLSTPWRIASIIAACILLVLTFIQTICAIISL